MSIAWRCSLGADNTVRFKWSKATYAYGTAVCLLEVGGDAGREEAKKLMHEVPDLRQKIAGKSLPLEVRYLDPTHHDCR